MSGSVQGATPGWPGLSSLNEQRYKGGTETSSQGEGSSYYTCSITTPTLGPSCWLWLARLQQLRGTGELQACEPHPNRKLLEPHPTCSQSTTGSYDWILDANQGAQHTACAMSITTMANRADQTQA